MDNVPVFEVAQTVMHKLGIKALVHGITKELRNNDGTVIQELPPEEYIYLIGYITGEGKIEFLKVNYNVLEPYAG